MYRRTTTGHALCGTEDGGSAGENVMKNSVKPIDTMMSQAKTYLPQRHSLGFDLKISGPILMDFARFADAMTHPGPITEELALAWAHSTKSERAITWARRIEVKGNVPALVKIAGGAEMSSINMDTLFIEEGGVPDGGRSGILDPESTEVELPLANAMHQFDA
ncbi:hypothetical protein PQQ73_30965 [Paraburkholderia strydomiana]|jgi:hypothetical protein|uniref:Uncharacterized protein n=2 Tax=Paraburkholderia strydomiana TaxID=1245417 RepID=A0ABW9ENX6_9BURK